MGPVTVRTGIPHFFLYDNYTPILAEHEWKPPVRAVGGGEGGMIGSQPENTKERGRCSVLFVCLSAAVACVVLI
jgi:hypothetical protein